MNITPVGTFTTLHKLHKGDLVFGDSEQFGYIGWKVVSTRGNKAVVRASNWADSDSHTITYEIEN